MAPIFLAVSVSLLFYLVVVTLLPARWLLGSGAYTKQMLDRLQSESAHQQGLAAAPPLDDPADNPLVRAFLLLPGANAAVPLVQRAGLWKRLDALVLGFILIFLFVLLVCARWGVLALPLAAGFTLLLFWGGLTRRVRSRKREFLDMFPDALDSIVRSVRSGYPLNSAIALVGENTPAPVGPEFKRVSDETSYGLTLFESLTRLADRIDEPDVRFFTVVLSVQQESGGNLSEVLGNLSHVLRKRRQMRLKIRALSSEGRTTAWIIGSLPLCVFAVLYYIVPAHMTPLFETEVGHIALAGVVGMVGTGMLIVRQIVNMKV